uniref:D(1B) dopamine receptor-like n=1 Tax=Styela clava TaxID=7725 RepID=UPI0019398AE4|nr:D(1B) dopamine receptor-like [Styela clava]
MLLCKAFVACSCLFAVANSQTVNARQPSLPITPEAAGTNISKSIGATMKIPIVLRCPISNKAKRACAKTIKGFKSKWYSGGSYLQKFFEQLKASKCPQLKEVCDEMLYSRFSEYSRLVYAFHCNPEKFIKECDQVIPPGRQIPSDDTCDHVRYNMTSSEFTTEELVKPCMQVAMYGSISGGFGYYHEVIDVYVPFCDISWCGFDGKTIEERGLTSWDCMTPGCRTNLVISSVVCALLALAIILANVTVIIVFTTSPKLRNSQAVYKISLAIADLLVGVIVLPTFVSTLLLLYQSPVNMGDVWKNSPRNSEGTLRRNSGGRFKQRTSPEYIDFVGFFTILSLIVSIYTLMIASFDRFLAIYQPMRYGRHNAKRLAIWASLGLWSVAILFSAMPFFVPEMTYGLAASIMVASQETSALILYAVVVVIPLIVVWVTTIATFMSTKKHARRRQTLTIRRQSSDNSTKPVTSMETRLARTLASMVGIFTLCLLPAAVILIVPHFLGNLYHDYPRDFDPMASKIFISTEFVTILILMTNSLWNCFIYNARSDDFKKAAKLLYSTLLRKLGFNVIWKRTRSFATSTVRGRRSTISTQLIHAGPSEKRSGRRKRSAGEANGVTYDRKLSETSMTSPVNIYRYTPDKLADDKTQNDLDHKSKEMVKQENNNVQNAELDKNDEVQK